MLIYSTASDESFDESDFLPMARRKVKRRLLTTSPSQSKATPNIQEPPVHTILFVPLNAADSMNRLNRQVTSMSLEALVPRQITDVRINGRKNVLAIDVTQRTALDVLTKVNPLGNINVHSFIPDGKDSKAGVIYNVDTSISNIVFPILIKPVTEATIFLQARHLGNSRCVKLVFMGDSLPTQVRVGHFQHIVCPFVPKPLQCRKFCKIGHVNAVCTSSVMCSRCSESHNTETCQAEHRKCANCQGPHEAPSKQCTNVKKKMQVLRQMARHGSAHREAAAKVRRRRSRHRKTPKTCFAKARDTPLLHITHSPPQASTVPTTSILRKTQETLTLTRGQRGR
ncbi:hypothetical protein HPB51_028323 [Rhipicephalus microplus]|uniref:Tick transposon n=1 Tax=Rhipicephalus microplus TaxID=6941 RepID=A0A9J6CXM4_RHIMP|nr:hypothetical protein HPB51_028323 [Rhipicephalus microplus]